MKPALLFGSSGLVGKHLLNELTKNNGYSKIKIFVRTVPEITDPKIEIFKIDFKVLSLKKLLFEFNSLFTSNKFRAIFVFVKRTSFFLKNNKFSISLDFLNRLIFDGKYSSPGLINFKFSLEFKNFLVFLVITLSLST